MAVFQLSVSRANVNSSRLGARISCLLLPPLSFRASRSTRRRLNPFVRALSQIDFKDHRWDVHCAIRVSHTTEYIRQSVTNGARYRIIDFRLVMPRWIWRWTRWRMSDSAKLYPLSRLLRDELHNGGGDYRNSYISSMRPVREDDLLYK